MSRPGDRHKGQRQYVSGAQKRKLSSAKLLKQEDEAKRTRNIADFLTRSSSVATVGKSAAEADDKRTTFLQLVEEAGAEPEAEPSEGISDVHITISSTSQTEDDAVVYPDGDDGCGRGDSVNHDSNSTSGNYEFNSGIGLWPVKCTSAMIDFWSSKDTTDLQNTSGWDFSKSVRYVTEKHSGRIIKRSCTEQLFQRIHPNGEIVKRTWLCYSPTTGRVYCFACRLLSTVEGQLTRDGFDDWKHAGREIQTHEKSSSHSNCVCSLVQRGRDTGRIDDELAQQINTTSIYWRNVLQRVVSVITFIAERRIAFRGDNEMVGSTGNGNFLGIIE
jgi:hypothetical protein